jgi:hypothetical protein
MQRQVRTTPRKRPRQARSRATVDSVRAATARDPRLVDETCTMVRRYPRGGRGLTG